MVITRQTNPELLNELKWFLFRNNPQQLLTKLLASETVKEKVQRIVTIEQEKQ